MNQNERQRGQVFIKDKGVKNEDLTPLSRAAVACIALSPGIEEGIEKRSPKGRDIAMIPNGCDLTLFRPGNRKNLDLPGAGPDDWG